MSDRAGEQAAHLVELGRYGEARGLLAGALATEPGDERLHGLMAQTLLGLDEDRAALEHANQVVALAPDDEWGHRLAAIALGRLKADTDACRAAEEAVRLSPTNWRGHQAFAMAASAVPHRRVQAVAAAARAVELAPTEPSAHFVVGLVAQRRGQRRAAATAYERVLALQPDHAEALNNLTVVRGHRRLGRAARGYSGSLRVDPHNAVVQRNVELLAVRFVRRIYLVALVAVFVGLAVVAGSGGDVGPASVAVAAVTLAVVTAYVVVVLRGVPTGVRRFVSARVLRNPILAATSALTTAMLVLVLVTCLVPGGYAVASQLFTPLVLANLAVVLGARFSRRR